MRKLTFLFALLCVSVMGFAIDWSGYEYLGDGAGGGAYSNKYKLAPGEGQGVVNIQHPGWATADGIYTTFPAGVTECSLGAGNFDIDGAGMILHLSAFTAKETEVTVTHGTGTCVFTVYYEDGTEGGAGGDAKTASELSLNSTAETLDADASQTFTIVPTTATGYDGTITYESSNTGIATVSSAGLVTAIGRGAATITVRASETENFTASSATFTATVTGALNWDAISWIGASGDKYKIDPAAGMNVVNVQKPGWAAEDGIYCTFPAGISACSLPSGSCAIDGAGIVLYLSAFAARETEVTVTANSVDYTFTVYYADGKEVVEVYDTNLALASNGSSATSSTGDASQAIDGNEGTRWESAQTDDETWTLDMGQKRIFNTIKILWETAFCNEFELTWSNDGENWTNLYTETNLTKAGWQTIELADNVTARYIKYHGTKRNTDWGQSFFEFQVLLPNASVLTSINLTAAAALKKIGQGVALTAQAKDQNNSNMAAEFSWEITPAGAGHVTEGVYYPDLAGNATIRAYSGEVYSNAVNVFAVSSDNLALSTNIDTDNKIIAQSEFAPDGTSAFYAVDGNNGSAYQGSATNGTADDETSRTYTSWFVVDLGIAYDIEAVTIYFEGACAQDYHVDFSANNVDWVVGYNHVGAAGVNGRTDILSSQLANTTSVRYVKFESTKAATQWGMKIFEFQVFGTESASLTKTVSASVNDAAMGTATVKQNDDAVTEVETGSTVTFSAVANDGYVFVNWSNGNTNATFTTTVDAAMNLTANFRALNHISCNEEMTNGDYTVYVTYKKTANDNEYQFIVRSAQVMTGFSNAYIGGMNGNDQINLNGQGVLTGNGHLLSYTFTSTTKPKLNSPLYVNFAGHGEVTFNQLNASTTFEFALPCEDSEITAIALNKASATLDMGNTLTLVPTFTPAYMSADITWETSDASKATVSNGVVTPVATGEVTITAKVSETIKATCTVTVQASTSHNWYGYATSQDLDYTYRIEYTTDHHIIAHVKRQGNKTGLVNASMNINNNWTEIKDTDGEEEGWKNGKTEATFTAGDNIHILIQSAYAGPTSIIEFDYEVGSDNVMPTIIPSTLALNNNSVTLSLTDADLQLTAEIHHRDAADQAITWTSDDESVATVVNGQVHPVGVGTTTIHATTHNGISASCEVTVVTEIEEANYYGSKTITVKGNPVGVNYSVTRNADHTLTYYLSVSEAVEGLVMQINDGAYHDMESIVAGREAQWTSTNTYSDGTVHNFFFYLPNANGAGRIDVSYTIGGASEEPNVMIALNDGMANNPAKIDEYNGQVADVVFSREFEDDGFWYTLCLPFDMSAAQLTEAFGAGYTLATLTGSEDRGSILHLNFNYVNTLDAGKPYMFRPGIAVTKENIPTINAVTINNTYVHSVSDHMTFQGTFTNMKLEDENQRFVGPENYLYEPADNGTEIDAFRCYFTIVEGAPGLAPGKRARIVFGEQTATGLDNTTVQHPDAAKLMLDGVLYIIREGRTYNAQGILVK